MSDPAKAEDLRAALERASTEAAAWLAAARARLSTGGPAAALAPLYASARRDLGTRSAIDAPGLGRCTVAAAARAVLLDDALMLAPDAALALARHLYRESDEAAQIDLVRSLPVLACAPALAPLALEAGRTNSRAVFEALALDNPYPARHYSEREFNQLVLKALFLGLPITRVVGLDGRANAELARMCEDYVEEREAAGRAVPADIWLALAPHASERGETMLRRYAASGEASHRRYAQEGLAHRDASGRP
ncbi:hypothetical protein SVA_3725 [Sulfurifustis variabilis]|uniref:Uncharacterized protein n=1 Tax=Sulfurifustis variabilis TaxID=1675686 RepID=A0A1B4V9L0_9GAMM|nr:EboA domain-containing protein [Sulfurifustis variabilis]BAU50259.1 hypothetical protein SVA_3725 [Sulfurifustis variabilis]